MMARGVSGTAVTKASFYFRARIFKMFPSFGTYVAGLIAVVFLYYFIITKKQKKRKQRGKPDEPIAFELKNIEVPPLSGWKLYVMASLFKIKLFAPIRNILIYITSRRSNAHVLFNYHIPDSPTLSPIVLPTKQQEQHKPTDLEGILKKPSEDKGFSFLSIVDLVNAYRSGKTTPIQVTENALEAIEKSEKLDLKLRAFVQFHRAEALVMAQESTKRYAENKPLSLIDGIPVGLKEDYEIVGYHTRMGTTVLGKEPETKDCNIVAKLRELGCIILGLTNMHEIGMGTTGSNPNYLHGTPRNPYNVDYHTGGSSSGSAAAVGAGLCPVTLGRDGGGSIRIPAVCCGGVGVKATYGRISAQGDNFFGGCTVSHAGPICNNVRDTAIMYALLSGRDVHYSPGLVQPEHATLEGFDDINLSNITIGIDWKFSQFSDQCVVESFEQAVKYLKDQGATVISIEIPELEEIRVAHGNIIGSELTSAVITALGDEIGKLNHETTILSKICFNSFNSAGYLLSQRQRSRAIEFMKVIFSEVDCVLTPATACLPPKIKDDPHKFGIIDGETMGKLMRFAFLGNLTGIPGIAVPFSYHDNGLPIGVQVMTSWWEEHVGFRVAHSLERGLVRKQPQVYFDILDPSKNILPK